MKNVSLIIAALLLSIYMSAQGLNGKVTEVIDGNTIEMIADDNESYKILLYGIDCPELSQPFGDKAQSFLQKKIINKNVNVQLQGKDRWGNRFGIVLIEGKKDPRYDLLEAGLAWTAERNPIEELETIKENARTKNKGLWQEQEPTPPWVYRRQQTMIEAKSR